MLQRLHPDATRVHVGHRADELRLAWRTRSLPHWRLVLAPLLLLGLIAGIAPGPWRFVAGTVTGLVVALWLALRDGRMARLERWRMAHDGHHRTARALRVAGLPLSADGRVVTTPAGPVLVDAVCWSGTVTVSDGVPVRSFADDPDGAVAMTGVVGRTRRLAREAGRGVRPVLVVWGDLPGGVVEAAGVTLVRGDLLAGWLADLPARRPVPRQRTAA